MNVYGLYAEAGSAKIGNEAFTVFIDNGFGDGPFSLFVFEDRSEYSQHIDMLCANAGIERRLSQAKNIERFQTVINGTFNIYFHDCEDEVCATLTGRYGAYTLSSTGLHGECVALVRWGDVS